MSATNTEGHALRYLDTMRRIPDDIILAVATREIQPRTPRACLCGWFLREQLAKARGLADAKCVRVSPYASLTGGSAFNILSDDWERIFVGIVSDTATVELAFLTRVAGCVS